ncbi:hypothetical protein [Labilithrix luteola]|uniref:hypothetical protein n=1 Tax=Labilithrix luteola TaxID=1391654 RepID=UPI001F0A3EB1|nr:hypothetical protein [Labilithrix luteola]
MHAFDPETSDRALGVDHDQKGCFAVLESGLKEQSLIAAFASRDSDRPNALKGAELSLRRGPDSLGRRRVELRLHGGVAHCRRTRVITRREERQEPTSDRFG